MFRTMSRDNPQVSPSITLPPGQDESLGPMTEIDVTGRTMSGRYYVAQEPRLEAGPVSATYSQDAGNVNKDLMELDEPPPPDTRELDGTATPSGLKQLPEAQLWPTGLQQIHSPLSIMAVARIRQIVKLCLFSSDFLVYSLK